ncbi:hypothetical protein PROFUN_09517 [Planoprotostelium fungivorum]|uniref:Glycoside hydrolase family 42 N-terminal domain-containing protein n=1 Tax=Planoprotostelium fungivorum TaxID=1890364 RepID=A0A2P6NH71_9EUKA|nr:hypothetical protein PROFUN_09517 [Planoprotostelium fungivorum]
MWRRFDTNRYLAQTVTTSVKCLIFLLSTCTVLAISKPVTPDGFVTFNTTITLQVVENPMLRRGSPICDKAFDALREMKAEMVRLAFWYPYPRLAVAELAPPNGTHTFWDFSLIDPIVEDFMNASEGRDVVFEFCTTPEWMWKTDQPVTIPSDPDEVMWGYSQGTVLIDPTAKQLGQYYARVLSWYTKGGFTDELGVFHSSNYFYNITHWEVLNEVEAEHSMSPETYTIIYDAIVKAILEVQPSMKFVGMALSGHYEWNWYKYFLNQSNHQPGVPIGVRNNLTIYNQFFSDADNFVQEVKQIIVIRDKLNPEVKLSADEVGVILPGDNTPTDDEPLNPLYWSANGAMYAYLAGKLGLLGYPSQFPSVTLVNYTTGSPNARLRVQNLIHQYIRKGNDIAEIKLESDDVFGLLIVDGKDIRVMLVNKKNQDVDVKVPFVNRGVVLSVDPSTGEGLPSSAKFEGVVHIQPWSVNIVIVE